MLIDFSVARPVKQIPTALSDLVFNYVVVSRAYNVPKGAPPGSINADEETLALDILLLLCNETMGYKFSREDLLAEVERRS